MEGWPDRSAFTDGFSKMIHDLSLDTRATMLFTSAEIYFKKVEVVVLDDSIYGDEGFDLLTASKQMENQQTNESHVEECLSGDSVGDFQLPNFESIFNFNDGWSTKNDALKNTPSATSECHFDTKGKSKVVCGDQIVHPKVLSNVDMDLDNIAYRTRSNFPIKNDCVDIDVTRPSENISVKPKAKACRSTTSTSNVCPKRKVKRTKNNSFFEFTKVAETRLRLPVDVSSDLCLSFDNLRDVSIQNLRCELSNMKTRAEKSGDGYSYNGKRRSYHLAERYRCT
ncbi:hypothetical protein HanIR_Chr16g0795011 [Helianthus annuus]|nr:hypothetical protein HanIR_Chr16g0795011 [Helianthus annuus]